MELLEVPALELQLDQAAAAVGVPPPTAELVDGEEPAEPFDGVEPRGVPAVAVAPHAGAGDDDRLASDVEVAVEPGEGLRDLRDRTVLVHGMGLLAVHPGLGHED